GEEANLASMPPSLLSLLFAEGPAETVRVILETADGAIAVAKQQDSREYRVVELVAAGLGQYFELLAVEDAEILVVDQAHHLIAGNRHAGRPALLGPDLLGQRVPGGI